MRQPARLAIALCTALLAAGCSTQPPSVPTTTVPSPSPTVTRPATPTASPTASASATPTTTPTPSPTRTTPPPDTRKGRQLRRPYEVNGIVVVSKDHRISAAYSPRVPTGPYGLEKEAAEALVRMTAAARSDGVRIRVRSGYRTYATQNAIYSRALRNYPHNIDYYAPAGASEHQTGLAVDLWDGVTWSLPMARTATGKWLFRNARRYGFVLRYPEGKRKITGYHYEPWHYRYLGTEHSLEFAGNKLTLEEYLGLA